MTDSGGNGGGKVDEALEFVKAASRRPIVVASPVTRRFDFRLAQDQPMVSRVPSSLLESLLGQVVVIDLRSSYVCLGTLIACDEQYYELRDADLHDFRDSTATREVYVYDSARFGIRRNRQRVLIRQDDVVAMARLEDIVES